MPLIQSRKYSHIEHYVSVDGWAEMQKKGLDKRYRIVDNKDIQDTVIKKPEIFEPESLLKGYSEFTASELRDELDSRGIDYPDNASKKELYEIYLNNG